MAESWNPNVGISQYPAITAVPALVPNAPVAENVNATAATSTAATRAVDQNELMSKGVENLISKDSGLMQQAAGSAKVAANSRGLLNSSMAVQAGQAAVMDRAMPIAQYDAGATTNVLNNNLGNQQQTNTFNAGNQQDVNKFNASNQQQNNQFNADKQNNNNIVNASEQNKLLAQTIDTETKKQLADVEASYKVLMQSEASAQSLYQASVKNISEIMMNPDLTAEAKTAAVNNQNSLLKSGMQIIGKMSNLNLDSLLTFPSV